MIGGADKTELIEAAAVRLELALMLGPCINANSSDHLTSAYVSNRSGAALNTLAPLTEFRVYSPLHCFFSPLLYILKDEQSQ